MISNDVYWYTTVVVKQCHEFNCDLDNKLRSIQVPLTLVID